MVLLFEFVLNTLNLFFISSLILSASSFSKLVAVFTASSAYFSKFKSFTIFIIPLKILVILRLFIFVNNSNAFFAFVKFDCASFFTCSLILSDCVIWLDSCVVVVKFSSIFFIFFSNSSFFFSSLIFKSFNNLISLFNSSILILSSSVKYTCLLIPSISAFLLIIFSCNSLIYAFITIKSSRLVLIVFDKFF